ncbi:proliferation marker protein Ki-67 isoform X2 [Sminthopsis crassicaudata]|uniref:proliferation marker protein Ki-67 isoform X2 n=1 Tax=Sminthopsis crassicaudata TaxID=9301 RepID=UPI003D6935B4
MTDTLGYVTIIKRTGADGYRYPLNRPSCLFGRSTECDIRLQLPVVSRQQCRIEFNQQLKEALLVNLNSSNPTHLNGTTICQPVKLKHGDLITIFDRSFRFEYESGLQNERKAPIRPSGPKNKEVMPARSRSISTLDYEQCQRRERHHHSFSDISTEHSEENNTRPFSLMSYLEEMNANKPKKCDDASENVEEHLAGKTPPLHKKEPKESTPNVTEKSSISNDLAADCSGDVNVSPTFPKKNENHDFSPFKKLFGLMKGELNSDCHQVGRQSYPGSRKSGPKTRVSMGGREQKTEPLQEDRHAKEGKHKSLAQGSPGAALELERSHEEERWFEDPYESTLEQSQAERFLAERPGQEMERLKAPRKRRSEGLAARNSGRKKEEDRRRSAPLVLPSESPNHPSPLYTLRSQTKRFSSWGSGKLSKLGGETAQTPEHMATPVLKESDFNGGGASPDLPKNKGNLLKNNQITPKKKASSSEEIAKETEKEELYFEGNVNESDRSAAKRRRVSFGVHLRPELFDENLPPNTPLKRGESPGTRRRGGSQPQTVLRKSIIKEHSKLLEKEPSSHPVEEGVPLHLHVQDLSPELPGTKKIFAHSSLSQSCENAESVAGENQLQKMNKPSSSKSPASGRRSQHDILQRIYAKRRSGASEANLMVVRSWADVVRLGTKKPPQADVVVKHGLERRIIKKQKRLTPKKPANGTKDSFGTGHANSPCTIVIGRAHTEKVTAPIRPCRMLNSFVLKTDMDMNEDFTGLADMFKIHVNKKRKSETGTASPLLFEEMFSKGHPHTSSGHEHTSDECAKKLIPTTQDAAQELLASSIFSCRRSPRNRQSRAGDNIIKIPEIGNDEIIHPGVEDHKILTSGSKRLKTCTPKENEATLNRNRVKTPENQKVLCIEEKLENGSASRATKKFKLSMEQSVGLNSYNPQAPDSTLNILEEDIQVIKRLTEMPNKGDSKENSIEKHTNLKNQSKEILAQLGVTPPLKIRSNKEQPVTNQPVEIPKHRRISLQNKEYSPTEVNKISSLKPVIVCPDGISTSETVPIIKHELGDVKKKVTRTPKQKIELVEYEDLSGIRELMATPAPTAKDKVADFTGDDGKVQKKLRSSISKQKIELVEDEDLSGIWKLMATPIPTTKDKVTDFAGDDGKVQKKRRSSTQKQKIEVMEDENLSGIWELMATPRTIAKDKMTDSSGDDGKVQRKRRSSIPKQKIELVEEKDLSGIWELVTTPRPTAKDQLADYAGDDGKVQRKRRSSIPKQNIELVEDIVLSGIRELVTSPRSTAKDEVADSSGDDGKVQRKVRSSMPKQKPELVGEENLSGIRELITTPRPAAKDKVADFAGDDGKVQKKRRSSTPKQKIELVEEENLSGIQEFMAIPRPTAENKMTDSSGDDGKVQKKRRSSTPKQKIEVVEDEDLSGIRELMTTPRPTTKDKVADYAGDEGKVQRKRRSSTPKQKIEVMEDEDLSGIRELMATPRPTAKDKVADSSGDEGKVQKKRRSSTPKQKIEVVEDEDLSGIRELMATPRPTAKGKMTDSSGDEGKVQRKRRSSTPKQKIEVVEDEDLSGIRELMTTPRPTTKDKVADYAGDEGKVQRKRRGSTPKQKIEVMEDEDLSGIRELMATPRPTAKDKVADSSGDEGKVQKKRRSSTPKQKIEVVEDEDLSGIRELMATPRPTAKDKVADSSGDEGKVQKKRRSSTPKQKIEVVEDEDLSGIRELMATPRPTAKDKVADSSGDEGKVQKKRRSSTPKQKIEVVEDEDLSGIQELMATPRPTAKDKMTDSSGDDGKVQRKRRSSTPKQKIEVVEDEDLSGIRELMATPRPTAKDKVADYAGNEGKVQKNLRRSTPKQKIEVVEDEDLSGIRELMATPSLTAKDKVADSSGDEGKVQRKRRSSTPKQKIEVVEDEDLSGIRELMATPRPTAKDKMTDSSGDDGKVQRKRRSSTLKQKIELVDDENLSGIRELMATPRPTAKDKVADYAGNEGKVQKKRTSTPKQKIEVVEDEDLSGIRELMETPRPTAKDKVAKFFEDDAKVQKNLTTSKQIVCTATDAKVQKKLMRSVKQQIEMENLNNTEQLKKTPKRKCEPVEPLTMVKRLMTSPKDKVEPGEVVCRERLLRTPKEKALIVAESQTSHRNVKQDAPKSKAQSSEDLVGLRRLVPTLKENLESLSTPKQRAVDLVEEKVNKDVILTKCESEILSRTRRQSRIAKEKEELIEDVQHVKNSIKMAKQKCDLVEDARVLGTKNLSKTQPVDDNSGLGKLISKPQEGKNVENIAYPKKLMKTPKEKIALLKIPTHKVKPEDLNMTFNERGELTIEEPAKTTKLVRTPKEKGQLDKDLTGVTVFMGTPNKVKDISDAQEISESDTEHLQELKMLRKKAIDDFSASNQEPQITEKILEPTQEVKPQTVGGCVRNKLPKSRKRVVGDVFQLKLPSRTKDSNFEVDYTGFKEMFESPKESKDHSGEVDQYQLQICTNPFEKDEDKSDASKIDGSLYLMSLKENIQKDEISQAQQEHDSLPSETENAFTKKTQKKSLLKFQDEIKDTDGLNQRTLRTRRKTRFDAESKLASTKIDDEKIVKNITTRKNKKPLDSFLDEVSNKNDSSERTLRSRRKTRFNAESRLASAKKDDESLAHSEKEEPVKTGPRTFCNTESQRHQTEKEVLSCSSNFSEIDKENSEGPVDNLRKRGAGRVTSRSRNKNAESPSESNVSHTNDEKCSDNKRLTEGKLIQKMAAPPLRFSSRNKINKELLGSPSPLLSETNRSPREKNEKKKRVTITTRNRSKADIKLQESTGSLVNDIVSSPKEGDKEEKFEKSVVNKGNKFLRSRNRNKNKDILPCDSNISYTDEERENIKNLPEKPKEQTVLVTGSRNSKFLNICDSLSSTGNNENPLNSCDQGRTDMNENGIGLRTRSRNKSKEKQESYPTHTECREDNERNLPARRKITSVNEKMASSRTRNRIKCATETQELNTLPAEVYKPQIEEEKSKVASPGKVGKSRSKKKMDLKQSVTVTSSPEKLKPQSKNQDVTQTQEISYSCLQTEPGQHNASLRSRTRKRLLPSSSVEPEELCLKDEKPVKTQKSLNDTTEHEKPSLRPKRKRKMDTELRDSAEEEKIPVGIRPLTRKRYKVDKELQEIPPVSSAAEIVIAEADEEKLSSLGNKLRRKTKGKTKESFEVEGSNGFPLPSATDIAYTLDLSPSGIFSNKRLTSRRGMGSRLKNKSDTNLQRSADISKTDPSTAGMSQTSEIGSKYQNKSDLEQQRSSNLSEDNSSTAASKTILTSGKAKRGKKVDFTLSTKKRGRPSTTSIKTEGTVVENVSIPHCPLKSTQVQDTFKDNLSAAKGTKSGLKAQSKFKNKTNQTEENNASSGSEKSYTLRGSRPTTRSSKQK